MLYGCEKTSMDYLCGQRKKSLSGVWEGPLAVTYLFSSSTAKEILCRQKVAPKKRPHSPTVFADRYGHITVNKRRNI